MSNVTTCCLAAAGMRNFTADTFALCGVVERNCFTTYNSLLVQTCSLCDGNVSKNYVVRCPGDHQICQLISSLRHTNGPVETTIVVICLDPHVTAVLEEHTRHVLEHPKGRVKHDTCYKYKIRPRLLPVNIVFSKPFSCAEALLAAPCTYVL